MIGEHKLIELVGTWTGSEELLESPWSPAGTAEGEFDFALAPGGGLLVDYTEIRDGTLALSGHGVLIADAWWWFDSYGFVPREPGLAGWEDGTLVLSRQSARGRSVMRLSLDDGELQSQIDSAVPPDAELATMLRGRYRRG